MDLDRAGAGARGELVECRGGGGVPTADGAKRLVWVEAGLAHPPGAQRAATVGGVRQSTPRGGGDVADRAGGRGVCRCAHPINSCPYPLVGPE